MFANLTTKIIYQKRLLLLWWFLGLMAMTTLTLSFFPAFKGGGLDQTFNNLPKSLQNIAGNAASFKTIGGYISQQIFALRMPLLTIILSIILFNGLTVSEERRGILETQLSLPLTRIRLLRQKLFAGILILTLASIGTFVGVVIGIVLVHQQYSLLVVLRETVECLLIGLDFGLITFMLGSAWGNKGLTVGLSSGYAFLSYLVSSMVASVPSLRTFDKLSLFHYYQNVSVFSLHNTLILAAAGIFVVVVGFVFFVRRDLKT